MPRSVIPIRPGAASISFCRNSRCAARHRTDHGGKRRGRKADDDLSRHATHSVGFLLGDVLPGVLRPRCDSRAPLIFSDSSSTLSCPAVHARAKAALTQLIMCGGTRHAFSASLVSAYHRAIDLICLWTTVHPTRHHSLGHGTRPLNYRVLCASGAERALISIKLCGDQRSAESVPRATAHY